MDDNINFSHTIVIYESVCGSTAYFLCIRIVQSFPNLYKYVIFSTFIIWIKYFYWVISQKSQHIRIQVIDNLIGTYEDLSNLLPFISINFQLMYSTYLFDFIHPSPTQPYFKSFTIHEPGIQIPNISVQTPDDKPYKNLQPSQRNKRHTNQQMTVPKQGLFKSPHPPSRRSVWLLGTLRLSPRPQSQPNSHIPEPFVLSSRQVQTCSRHPSSDHYVLPPRSRSENTMET